MNAIVAIGGPSLFSVIDSYRTLVPGNVWVLGLPSARDTNDPLLWSLEALLDPLMTSYFEREAQSSIETARLHLAQQTQLGSQAERDRLDASASAALGSGLASAMSLVEMLDRANTLIPIELVVSDDMTILAQTAIAWAQARMVPAFTLPAGTPLRRPLISEADRTIVVGKRAKQAYLAAGIDPARLVSLEAPNPHLVTVAPDDQTNRHAQAKEAFGRVLGWSATDIVVVFDPAGHPRDAQRDWAAAFQTSLTAMFAAFATARAHVSSLRLAVVTEPSPEGLAWAGPAAAQAGIAQGDFAYAQADQPVWIAGADIIVSIDGTRAIEAAAAGVPAIDLRGPANGFDGPSFAADDGVIDASSQTLASMLVALAGDSDLRMQIAAIAGGRIAGESPASAPARAEIARVLVALRRIPPTVYRKPKPDIVIWAPDYNTRSGGIRALYRLCHFINLAGGNASMHAPNRLHPEWNTPRRVDPITDRTIVVLPEIAFSHPSIKRVVRWVLNKPGLLGGPATYGPDEMVFYYAQAFREAAQAATAEILTDEREFTMSTIEPELFYNDLSRPRLYDCVYIGKGESIYRRIQLREARDAVIIRNGAAPWPESRVETAALLRGCRRLYSFDQNTAIVSEAILCGVPAFYVRESGALEEHHVGERVVSDYLEHYYDLTDVERFLRLLQARWD